MHTIAEILDAIPPIQGRIDKELKLENTYDDKFAQELFNFLTIYYFQMLSHVCMDELKNKIDTTQLAPAYEEYYSLSEQMNICEGLIRNINISGLLILWLSFERFVFRNSKVGTGKVAGDFKKAHKSLMEKQHIKCRRRKEIDKLFTGIRRTRNTLHENGVYRNENNVSYKFTICSIEHILEPDESVKPIRLIDLINTFWEHYIELKTAGAKKSNI